MDMNLEQLKTRLMTAPDFNDPEIQAARRANAQVDTLVADAEIFESRLQGAVSLRTPPRLAESIIEANRQSAKAKRPELPWMLATAASVTVTLGLIGMQLTGHEQPQEAPGDVWSHLAWHWQFDGEQAIAASLNQPGEPAQIVELLAGFGLQADTTLLARSRLGKVCPTPDGKGAHIIADFGQGPTTLIVMPYTTVPHAPASAQLAGDMEAWVVNLERGSLAVIAPSGSNSRQLALDLKGRIGTRTALSL